MSLTITGRGRGTVSARRQPIGSRAVRQINRALAGGKCRVLPPLMSAAEIAQRWAKAPPPIAEHAAWHPPPASCAKSVVLF
ncbi:MAG: hypothetical protein JWM95_1189 [Gemmatimonadetes bacterium]|nr:hypothetical protein [Gemmatimonadota bacterium]